MLHTRGRCSLLPPVPASMLRQLIGSFPSSGLQEDRGFGPTVVVAPPAIIQQWRSEIHTHTGGRLRVVVYDGLKFPVSALEPSLLGTLIFKRENHRRNALRLRMHLPCGSQVEDEETAGNAQLPEPKQPPKRARRAKGVPADVAEDWEFEQPAHESNLVRQAREAVEILMAADVVLTT